MGLFSKIFYGVDLDEEQKRQDDLERQYQADRQRTVERLNRTQGEEAAARYRDESAKHSGDAFYVQDVSNEVSEAFDEGLDDGAANIRATISDTAGAVIGTPFKILPAWLILVLIAGAALWFFGLPKFLRPSTT